MKVLIIVLVIIGLIIAWIVRLYNTLIVAKNKVLNQFSQIDIQLKRRADLIPNLVETVKGYAKHEKETFEDVVNARNKALTAGTINEKVEANNQLEGALNKLFALAESYPELKSNENFLSLQTDLKETEDKITYARQFYNDTAMSYNNLIAVVPTNIVASLLKFEKFDYFKADEKDKETPKVKF